MARQGETMEPYRELRCARPGCGHCYTAHRPACTVMTFRGLHLERAELFDTCSHFLWIPPTDPTAWHPRAGA